MKEITVPATIDQIPIVTEFIDNELESNDSPPKTQIQIDVAIDELFSNITFYAYESGTGDVTVQVEFDEKPSVKITFIDNGIAYNPLEKEDPDITMNADERGIGGLGIFIVKKTMDDVIYRREDDKNILSIVKSLE